MDSCDKLKGEACPGDTIYSNGGDDAANTSQVASCGPRDAHLDEESGRQDDDDGSHGTETGIKVIPSPGTPSRKEREEHEVHHWPYRGWCDHCVKGRTVGQPHRSMKGEYAEATVA